ncbi:CSS-motif domain-containing protein [Pseudomonas sp. Teo4]|uniref:CSS-motif domain-containing protein n=1 Tax=Pseudomonas sp. Teo4 TaxID=3064528 RepID=UPI002ACB123A|nr:CSS-motif domain-containing protein [Pseudomonas sp. Teo4]
MSKLTQLGRFMLAPMLAITTSLMPVASGLLVMLYQMERRLEENARVSVQEAVYAIDIALDRLQGSAKLVLPLAGQPCSRAKGKLVDLVQGMQHLRSLTLAQDGKTYCSSTSGKLSHESLYIDQDKPVMLVFDPPTAPNSVLVVYQLRRDNLSVYASTYGLELSKELRSFQDGLTLLLEFGEHYIWSDGDSRDAARPSQSEYFETAHSMKYGYTVKGGYEEGFTAREARQSLLQIMPSLALVGILTGSIVYWGIVRMGRKKLGATACKS